LRFAKLEVKNTSPQEPADVVSFIILSQFLCRKGLSILDDGLLNGCNGNNKKGMIMQSRVGYFPSYPRDAYLLYYTPLIL
jgi:hypothetical protein